MNENLVGLNAGHNKSDSGAVNSKTTEVELNCVITDACRKELEINGIKTIQCDGSLKSITDIANRNNVRILISIHNNAGGGDGFGSYIYKKGGESEKLARLINKQVINVDKLNNAHGDPLKVKNLHVVRESKMPAVLLECAFMDSKDFSCVDDLSEQIAFGKSIAKAIMQYLGVTTTECSKTHKVTVDGKQIGAYKNHNNILEVVKDNLGKNITIK